MEEKREGEKKKKRKRKRRRREAKKKKRFGCLTLVWILVVNCMFFVHKLFGYGLLGFYLEINLVPFSRALLGGHPNSRFKGSLVENP